MEKKESKPNAIAEITQDELALVNNNLLNPDQLNQIFKATPPKYVKLRPGKGGGDWKYVSAGYIQKVLNLMFGWDWDFEIIDEKILVESAIVIVKGKLTCRSGDRTIVKMQYGRKEITMKRGGTGPLDVGNDLKAAASDCLKKCASLIGIASDIYSDEDFKELQVISEENKGYKDIESVETDQEEARVLKHIQNAKTLTELEMAKGYVDALSLDNPIYIEYKKVEISLTNGLP
jgi:Rad52/22 family double-strand break repair protein